MSRRESGKGHFGPDHSTYFAHTFNRCLESTFSPIIQRWMVPCGWVGTLGPGFCEWVRKVGLLSDARPQRLSVLTLTSVCTACFSWGPHLGHSQLPQGTGLSTQQPSLRPHLLLTSMCYLWVRCWSPEWQYIHSDTIYRKVWFSDLLITLYL